MKNSSTRFMEILKAIVPASLSIVKIHLDR
jgi:hypothetical protein